MITNSISRQTGKSTLAIVITSVVAIIIGVYFQQSNEEGTIESSEFEKITILPTPKALDNVNFTDHNGDPFTEKDLIGKWSILFFAFTNCPDVCPSTLHTLKQVKQNMGQEWSPFQLLMITVDPARDTSERLSQYVPFFDPEFIGLRADLDYTSAFAKDLGVLFFKGKVQKNGGYDVDHSAYMILINPKGQYAGVISAPHKQKTLQADLTTLSRYALRTGANQAISTPATTTNKVANSDTNQSTKRTSELVFKNSWIRPAPPSAPAMAAYASIENQGHDDVNIVDASSPLFDMVMIHKTLIKDGVASMQHMDGLEIKAGGNAALSPMGKHIMLMRPKKTLPIGSKVPVQFVLDNGQNIEIEIEVRNNPTPE